MRTARYNGSVSRIVKAGTQFQLSAGDFILYNNGVQEGYNPGDCTFVDCQFMTPLFIQSGNGTNLLTIVAGRHRNSLSLSDDNNNVTPNTGADDIAEPKSNALMGTLRHPISGDYMIDPAYFYYCAAMYPPTIDVARLRTVLKSTGNDYNTIFVNANINSFSPSPPNKTVPHTVDEVLGYSARYLPVVVTNPTGTYTLDEGEIDRAFTYKWATNGSPNITQISLNGSTISNPSNYGTRTITFSPGTYNITSTFTYSGTSYITAQNKLTVNAAPVIITAMSITGYDTLLSIAQLSITANASASYTCWVTTTWVEGMVIVGTVRTNMGTKSVTAGTTNPTQNVPTTKPANAGANATIGGVKIEYVTGAGNVAKFAQWTAQQTSNLSVTPTSLSFTSLASTKSITVTSDYYDQWTASANQTWITLTKVSDGYNVAAATNPNTSVRTATITVTDLMYGETKTVSVSQAAASAADSVSANPSVLDFGWNDGMQQLVDIYSSGPWTITIPASYRGWIFVDSNSGNNGDTIGVSVAENFNYTPRMGSFVINCGTASQTVTVNQDGQNT